MNFQKIIGKMGWRATVIAMITVLLGLFFLISPLGLALRHLSYDIPFYLKSGPSIDEAVIVYLDEESHRQLKQTPGQAWDRALHVRLLNELSMRRARVVVFDVLLDQPWKDKKVDEQLAEAIKAHGRVVLAASCQHSEAAGEAFNLTLIRAVDPLGSAAPWGIGELPKETDGKVRRHSADPRYPSLAWKVAELLNKAPADRVRPRWLNYYGPRGTIPSVSYCQVLERDALPKDFFDSRIVFIGGGPAITYQGSKTSDEFSTPHTSWTGHQLPGVEIQATAALNLLREDWLTEFSPVSEILLVIFFGLLVGFGFARMPPWICAWCLPAGVAVVALLSLFLFGQHLWYPWMVVAVIQIPAAVVGSYLVFVMPAKTRYHAFISYRRKVDETTACLVQEKLAELGIKAFRDTADLGPGHWGERLMREIETAPSFIVILSPGSFALPVQENDFLLKEINHARDKGKNIIPLVKPDFLWEGLPTDISCLRDHQLVEYYSNMTPEVLLATMKDIKKFVRSGSQKSLVFLKITPTQ